MTVVNIHYGFQKIVCVSVFKSWCWKPFKCLSFFKDCHVCHNLISANISPKPYVVLYWRKTDALFYRYCGSCLVPSRFHTTSCRAWNGARRECRVRSPLPHLAPCRVLNEDDWGRVSCGRDFYVVMPIEPFVLCQRSAYNLHPFRFSSIIFETETLMTYANEKFRIL